jgi:formyltetrahydrofolate deformylase
VLFNFLGLQMPSHILLINCPDESGLVYKITSVVYKHNLNIISNGEFVERTFNYFFMRTEFSGAFHREKLLSDLKDALPQGVEIRLTDNRKKNVVILATKEHHCLSDLLIRHAFNELQANVLCVVSNHELLKGLVEKFNVPFYFISHEKKSKEKHEQEIVTVIEKYNPDFLVLAKYMRILSAAFADKFANRIINIHHSFLPAFVGASPYVQAYERGVKIIGATAHFVNNNLDEGPIIAQNVIPDTHSQSAREMAQAGRDVEKIVLANALQLVFNERVFVYRNKTIIFD